MIQQSANPNATNSELDAKKIVKNVELTSLQRDELIEQYVELQVDNMDYKSLVEFVTTELQYSLEKYSDIELREDIEEFDEGLYDKLVNNISNTDRAVQ